MGWDKIKLIINFNKFLSKFLGKFIKTFGSCICSGLLIFSVTTLAAGKNDFVVISDVDDTLKITNVPSYGSSLKNLFFGKKTFLGMSELFKSYQNQTQTFYYLSAAPQSVLSRVENMLIHGNHFPKGIFLFSNWFDWKRNYDFKYEKLIELAKSISQPFLLIGDDTQSDPDVFQAFKANQNSEKILQVYVHRVTNRSIPTELVSYSTSFDLILNEVEAGRVGLEEAVIVGKFILQANRPDEFLPNFQYCPTDFSLQLGTIASTSDILIEIGHQIEAYIRTICKKRKLTTVKNSDTRTAVNWG
jgi:hypothetical protein